MHVYQFSLWRTVRSYYRLAAICHRDRSRNAEPRGSWKPASSFIRGHVKADIREIANFASLFESLIAEFGLALNFHPRSLVSSVKYR